MTTIRHICAGHEYRYDTVTGHVRNNYGTHVSALRICQFTGKALLYRVADHWPVIHAADLLASAHAGMNDELLAIFAIGQTAANIEEA